MNENRRLRKLQLNLIEQVITLFDIDLVKNKHIWKDKLEVRILKIKSFLNYLIKQVVKKTIDIGCQGKDPNICNVWKYNWDVQLYKALEH